MNRILFLSVMIASLGACTHVDNLYKAAGERIANCVTSEAFDVPVRQGYATYVKYGQDTIAVTTEPITIQIPKKSVLSTKGSVSEDITLDYEVFNDQPTYSQYWQAIMFEDTKNGDYDYNDLVIHVRNKIQYDWNKKTKTFVIDIQPIALGSQKTIKLGCIVVEDQSARIISNDVRKDLFNNAKGFVNTVSDESPIHYELETSVFTHKYETLDNKKVATLAWFIEVDEQRYFAVNGDLDYKEYDILNLEGMPYGLVIYGVNKENGTFSYPEEKTSMFKAYPDFRNWIDGVANYIGTAKDKSLIYKYNYTKLPGTTFNKIWDY